MALGGDLVLDLPAAVDLLLERLQLRDPLTHPFDGDQAEGAHAQRA